MNRPVVGIGTHPSSATQACNHTNICDVAPPIPGPTSRCPAAVGPRKSGTTCCLALVSSCLTSWTQVPQVTTSTRWVTGSSWQFLSGRWVEQSHVRTLVLLWLCCCHVYAASHMHAPHTKSDPPSQHTTHMVLINQEGALNVCRWACSLKPWVTAECRHPAVIQRWQTARSWHCGTRHPTSVSPVPKCARPWSASR